MGRQLVRHWAFSIQYETLPQGGTIEAHCRGRLAVGKSTVLCLVIAAGGTSIQFQLNLLRQQSVHCNRRTSCRLSIVFVVASAVALAMKPFIIAAGGLVPLHVQVPGKILVTRSRIAPCTIGRGRRLCRCKRGIELGAIHGRGWGGCSQKGIQFVVVTRAAVLIFSSDSKSTNIN